MLAIQEIEAGSFSQSGQERFSRLSGDFNPVHTDPIAARRTLFGQPIVHGMHLVLRALEIVSGASATGYSRISARFHRPVFLEEALTLSVVVNPDGLELTYVSDGAPLTTITLSGPATLDDRDWAPATDRGRTSPRDATILDNQSVAGVVELSQPPSEMRALFPAASALYGANRLSNLLGITYVIGMEVPGLHSMFATLSVELLNGVDNKLEFAVTAAKPKLSYVRLEFASAALRGAAEAFIRPRTQPIDFEACRRVVSKGEFRGRRALIVGGSRGLGRLTANLLGAGGAELVLTYRTGEAEAEAAVVTMRENGVTARAERLDVSYPSETFAKLRAEGISVTDLFYFATPHIFVRKKKLFEPHLLSKFLNSYVTDFLNVVAEAKVISNSTLAIFYPSSDALNNPIKDLAEYYTAKRAGEAACEMLALYDSGVKITVSRLPRLPTDQTATMMAVATEDPLSVLLGVCREMSYSNCRPAFSEDE